MTQRPGGFPRINRPPSPAKPATAAVEPKPATAAQQAPRTGFPRLPVRPVPLAPAAVKYDAPHSTTRPLPVDEFFANDMKMDADSIGPSDPFTEPLDEDPDDAPVITVPLQPLPRPEPTVLHPTPASRAAPPPQRRPGYGLLASNVVAPARTTPTFLPPPREFPHTQAKAPPPPPQARDAPRPAASATSVSAAGTEGRS
jgi:hypothetical protein